MSNSKLKQWQEQRLLENYYTFQNTGKTNIEIANETLRGKRLLNLYKTIGSQQETQRFFELVLETDEPKKYRFTEVYLTALAEAESFGTLTEWTDHELIKDQIIKGISASQYGEWTLELENGTVIESRDRDGTEIYVGKKYW